MPSWKLVLGTLATLGLGLVVLGGAAFGIAWARIDIPEESEVAAAQTSIVYWNDGTTEMARLGDTNRISVPIADVPLEVQRAVLAAEDRSFYEHGGFAITGFVRALWTNLTTGSSQGGSTITQQYAKNAYLSADKTLARKFKELVLSLKLESQLSKDEILERYLNTIYFGRGSYGIETAAEAYFDTNVADLTLEQGAVLAAILNGPGSFNPENNLERLQARYAYVLNGMVEAGWLEPSARDQAVEQFPDIIERRSSQKYAGTTGYLIRAVQDELLSRGFTEAEVEGGGLRVTSTFDEQSQDAAVAAVDEQGPTTGTQGLRIGLAAVQPVTGEVVAMYGGADYLENSLNNATQAIQQAGSTFKPFGLAAGLEQDVTLDSLWPGNSPHTTAGYVVRNYGNNSYGDQVTLLKGTEESINTVYVQLSDSIGVDSVVDAALRAGIPADTTGMDTPPDLTFVLGTDSPHTIDIAASYATFASRGEQATPTVLRRVGTAEGGVLYERTDAPVRAFDEQTADLVNYALQKVVTDGTGGPARAVGRPVAGKTGSTDEYMSAWFAGYTPQLAAAVSFSKDDEEGNPVSLAGTGGMVQFYGSGYPARVWTAFMRGALEGTPVEPFAQPEAIPSSSPTPSPSTSETRSATPSPSTSSPTPSASPTPTQTLASPTPSEQTTSPAPTAEPTATATGPSPAVSGDAGNGGNGAAGAADPGAAGDAGAVAGAGFPVGAGQASGTP